ncbi:MAG TPA: glycosyltransferase [Coleofasciculaceae cyanobacterium]|jgi:glycosyltransferase involved in cell wall biosynthesis
MIKSLQLAKPSLSQQNPLVSVIIGNYNYGYFLAEAIESVLQQTYRHFELIVVDDGSTDNSREVIESYQELIAIFQPNSGQGEAFNVGITKAQGEIICFLDADDYYHPDKLRKIVSAFCTHPRWVQISHGRIAVDRDGTPIGKGSKTHNQGDVSHLLLRWGRYAMSITSALAYRRQILEQVLPIPTTRNEAADTYLTAAVPFYGEVGCIDEPLMFYRIHGNNLQARTDNIQFLLEQRESNANYINATAAKVGLRDRFDLERDADYRSLKAVQQGTFSFIEMIQVIWLSWRESRAIKRSSRDILERLLRRGLCVLIPSEGKAILRLGLRGYFRRRLTRVGQRFTSVATK